MDSEDRSPPRITSTTRDRVRTYMHAHARTRTHTHIHTHIHIRTHTTHTHTHTQKTQTLTHTLQTFDDEVAHHWRETEPPNALGHGAVPHIALVRVHVHGAHPACDLGNGEGEECLVYIES